MTNSSNLSLRRHMLCSRRNAMRVAGRLFDDRQRRVVILRTTQPLQPYRVSNELDIEGDIVAVVTS